MRRGSRVWVALVAVGLGLVACGPRFDRRVLQGSVAAPSPIETSIGTTAPSAAPTAAPRASNGTRRTLIKGTRGSVVTGGVIKVGGLFPLSGGLSTLGEPAWQAAEAYFRWVNDRGGVRGKTIDFIECDDQADDTRSTTCAKRLLEQDGIFIMGPSFTPFSFTVIEQLEQAGVPWVGFDGINVEGFDAANVVTVGAPIETMAHAILPYWVQKERKRTGSDRKLRIGALVLDVPPAIAYVNEAKKVICPKLNCEIARDDRVTYTTTTYATICNNMAGLDAVWIVTDPASAVKMITGCPQMKGKFLGQHGIYMDLTLQQAGRNADGMLANGAVLPDSEDTAATREMRQIVNRYYPGASFGYFATLAYASARMVVDLLDRVIGSGADITRAGVLSAAGGFGSYACNGLCRAVNLAPPAGETGGNHNIWIVRADFSSGSGRWVNEAGPIDAFRSQTWPCPGRPRPC